MSSSSEAAQQEGEGLTIDGRAVSKSKFATPEYVAQFRKDIESRDDAQLVIGRGEVVTVRVQKRDAKPMSITWEFNTLNYDIAFGVDFETTDAQGATAVHALLPVIRVDSSAQVVTGTHHSAEAGCWLLRFDNSFSYLRSKTVLYRIFVNNNNSNNANGSASNA